MNFNKACKLFAIVDKSSLETAKRKLIKSIAKDDKLILSPDHKIHFNPKGKTI